MALVRVAQVHFRDAGLVQVILEGAVELFRSLAGLCEFGKTFFGDARDDFAVAEGSVVACVADELRGVVQEVLEVVVGHACLGLHFLPVALQDVSLS